MIIQILKARSKKRFAPLAWIIRKSQKTKHNHYAIQFTDEDGVVWCSDAKAKGVRKVSYHEWIKQYSITDSVSIDMNTDSDIFNAWVDGKVGAKYPFWQLIGIGAITLGIIKRNPFGKNKRYLVCHEYVLVTLARFLKLDIGDSDDYDFRAADLIINSVASNE